MLRWEGPQCKQPVVIGTQKTVVKISLETRREAPHVEAVNLVRTLVQVVSLDLICCRWGCQLSFLSSMTPRTHAEGLE